MALQQWKWIPPHLFPTVHCSPSYNLQTSWNLQEIWRLTTASAHVFTCLYATLTADSLYLVTIKSEHWDWKCGESGKYKHLPAVLTRQCHTWPRQSVWFMARPLQWRSEQRVTGSHHFPSEDDSVHRHDACRWRGGSLQQSRKCMRGSGELKYLWCQYLPGTTLIAEVWPAAVTTWCAGMGAYSTSFVKKGWKRHFWWFDFEKKECQGRCTHAKFTQNILFSCFGNFFKP